MDKSLLRAETLEKLKTINDQKARETIVCEDVLAYLEETFPTRRVRVAAYLGMQHELSVDGLIRALLAKKHKVYVPVVVGNDLVFERYKETTPLRPGAFGIREPYLSGLLPPKTFDVVIVPLVAFDGENRRLGRGKGYYDRFLAKQPSALKLGVAFREQKTDEIPVESHDVRLDRIFCS